MREDPVEWLDGQYQAGVDLREEGRYLQLQDTDDWERRAEIWFQELRDGIVIRNRRDVGRVKTLDSILLLDISSEHPWYDSRIPPSMHLSATGWDCPGNNPLNRHATRVARVKEILAEWRAARPKIPKPAPAPDIAYHEFVSWYAERADNAKPEDRSSREEDINAAMQHFKCRISYDWVIGERTNLPSDHPYKTKGRRPG